MTNSRLKWNNATTKVYVHSQVHQNRGLTVKAIISSFTIVTSQLRGVVLKKLLVEEITKKEGLLQYLATGPCTSKICGAMLHACDNYQLRSGIPFILDTKYEVQLTYVPKKY